MTGSMRGCDPRVTASTPKPVYVVFGSEPFLRRHALREVHRSVGVASDPMACTCFDAEAELADVLDELRTVPLLAARRLVTVDDADTFISTHRAALERYLSSPSDSASLLLICKSFPSNTRLYRMAGEIGGINACEPLKGGAVPAWITRQAQEAYGKRIDRAAAVLLRQLVEDDLGTLDGEIAKLAIFVGDRLAITATDVEVLVGLSREQKVFGIADAMTCGDGPRALGLWEQVWATDRAAPGRAIGGLAWGLRRYVESKHALDAGEPCDGWARQLWVDPAELRRRLGRLQADALERLLVELLSADVAVKTGLGEVRAALEKLICRSCDPAC